MKKDQDYSSYQQFHNKMRAKFKKQKQERKQNLRQIQCKKLVQSSQGSNDEQFIKKTMKRGNKWWNKVNRYYFQKLSHQFIDNMRQFTTSQDIIQFGSQFSPLLIYYQQVICTAQPYIFQDDSIRILYRIDQKIQQTEKHVLVGYTCQQHPTLNKQHIQLSNYRLPNFYSFHSSDINPPKITIQSEIQKQSKQAEIMITSFCDDEQYITKCLQYEMIWRKEGMTEIQKEIQCWKYQLECQHKKNVEVWDRFDYLAQKQNEQYPQIQNIQQKIEQVKKMLIKSETFSYFRLGYADKNIEQYEKTLQFIKQNQAQQQKQVDKVVDASTSSFFETDCKVCFCTKNEPCNKVIYCDSCSTSFHQSCYGIQTVQQDKQIICDVCAYEKKYQNQHKGLRPDLPTCQICGRGKFPIKCIDEHFYHVSCLILFDFAQIHEFQISLKPGITHFTIMEAVVQNEMEHDYCQFCAKYSILGMQFRCSSPLCAKSFHPICAYLNGCTFSISRKLNGGIDVRVQCRDHQIPQFQDLVNQVFLRRFLCNYKNTAKVKQNEFRAIYERQLQKTVKNPKLTELLQSGIKRILKFKIPKIINLQQKPRPQLVKKSQSNISANSNNSGSKSLKQTPKSRKSSSTKEKSSLQKARNQNYANTRRQ